MSFTCARWALFNRGHCIGYRCARNDLKPPIRSQNLITSEILNISRERLVVRYARCGSFSNVRFKRKDEDDDYLEGGRRKSARDRSYDSDASSYSSTSPRSKRRHHDKRRSSPNSKHRKHHRHRSRSRSRDSYRSDHRRRRRSRSRSYDRRTTSDSTSQSEPASSALKPITLKDVISANPGISMPEAVMRLNAHNLAVSRGEPPPPLSGSLPVPLTSFAAGNLLGDGGAATKPHREM